MAFLETFGPLRPRALDLLLCSILWRARAEVIRLVRQHDLGKMSIEIEERPPHNPGGPRTVVDSTVQAQILASLEALLPDFGRRAEEDDVYVPPTGLPITITVDPLDGTARFAWLMKNSFARRDGVCIMLAVLVGTEVVAAYILDVFNSELYRVPPGHDTVLYSTKGDDEDQPVLPATKPSGSLAGGTLMLNCEREFHQPLMALLGKPQYAGLFGNTTVIQSGIGGSLLRIINGEAVAMARRPGGSFTDWDEAPLIGLCRAANIRTFAVVGDGLQEVAVAVKVPSVPTPRPYNLLYIPERYVDELMATGLPVSRLAV